MSRDHPGANVPGATSTASPCLACGACCDYSSEWPRFSTESDAELASIPEPLIAKNLSGMRCVGTRCSALAGKVGEAAHCTIYAARPHVCRACEIGDDECLIARDRHGLAPIERIV